MVAFILYVYWMIKGFINTTFNVDIKWVSFEINKCKVKEIPKMIDFTESIKKYNTETQLYFFFRYVSSYIEDIEKRNIFIELIESIDQSIDLWPIIKILNDWLYWAKEWWDEWWWDHKSIIKWMLFVQKYYWLSNNDLYNLTLEQFWYYSEMVLAIENPEEYKKQERNNRARSWDMTLDELKNFIFNK